MMAKSAINVKAAHAHSNSGLYCTSVLVMCGYCHEAAERWRNSKHNELRLGYNTQTVASNLQSSCVYSATKTNMSLY